MRHLSVKVLVTGAGGFIGEFLTRILAASGKEVIGTYRTKKPAIGNSSSSGIKLLQCDLSEGLQAVGPVDVVVHTAGVHPNSTPRPTMHQYVRSNVLGTTNLVDYCRDVLPRLCIYLSAISAYGVVNASELHEDTPLNNPTMYGLTKFLGEVALGDHRSDFSSISIRLPGVLGRNAFTPWLGTVLKKALLNQSITIYNADSLFNNAVDLIELGKFVSLLTESGFSGFTVVNIGAAEPMRIRDVVKLIVSLTGSTSAISEEPAMKQSFSIRTDRIRNLFGFEPAPTRDIISRYVCENMVTQHD